MKKYLIILIVVVLIVSMSLLSCKKEAPATTEEVATTEEAATTEVVAEPVTIRVSTFFAHDNPEVEQAVVAAFEEANPNITVQLEEPSTDDIWNTLTADIAAGTPPDVISMNYERLSYYVGLGAIEPLTDYVANENYDMSIYYENTVAMHTLDGVLYGLPATFSDSVLCYNKTMFDEAGIAYPDASWDWATLVDTAKQFVKDTDDDGVIDVYGYGPAWWPLYPLIFDTNILTPDNSQCALGTPEGIQAIQAYVDLQGVDGVTANAEARSFMGDWDRWVAGNLAMYEVGPWAVKPWNDSITEGSANYFVWDCADTPRGTVQGTFLYSNCYAITSGSQAKDAAWEFVKFATGSEGCTIRQEGQYEISAVKSVAESIFVASMTGISPAHPEVFMTATSYGKKLSQPQHASLDEILAAIQAELDLALNGQKTVPDAMSAASEAVNAIIEAAATD